MAVPMNSINDMHATIDRSLEDRSTSRENSGGLPSSIRLRVQRKNVWMSAAPPMRRKITGETPATSNGASSLALKQAPRVQEAEAGRQQDDAGRRQRRGC